MSARDPLDELALDHLYGLTDPADAETLARLDTPEGRAALARAGRVQMLLTAAAKSDFPGVRFEPPVAEPARAARPARRWLAWCAAAAVLVAAGTPPAANLVESSRRRGDVAQAEVQRAAANDALAQLAHAHSERVVIAQQQLVATKGKLAAAETTLAERLAKAQNELRAKQLSLVISGPATLTPGAPNDYRVQTLDGRNRPALAVLAARVKDQAGTVVFEDRLTEAAATWNLKLPADLPLTPDRELYLELEAKGETGPKSELRERLQLATPIFVTHLTTDKPLYQPGETVRFRSLTLDRLRLRPPAEEFTLQYLVRDPLGVESPLPPGRTSLVGPDGKPINGPDGKPVRGVGAGEWAIPESAAGGEYTLAVRETSGRFPEEKRTFLVNKYQPARINKVLEWSRKSYGPGDEVVANCKATKAEGGALANRPVTATVRVDDATFAVTPNPTTDAEGRVAVRFKLPAQIERGVASLNVAFNDGGSVETLNKPIPVVLKKLHIDFYPEGGDLVAGVPNRVYFQVRSTLGKPADLTGRIVDAAGQTVATAATLTDTNEPGINQGQGRVEFTPEFGQSYRLLVDTPVGTEGEYKLPAVAAEGVVLSALDPVSAEPEALKVRVHSAGGARSLFVGAYGRGRMLDHRRVQLPANGSTDVELTPQGGLGGVTRITVFEEQGGGPQPELRPVAERLVYRKPSAKLNLAVKPNKARYAPGEPVSLELFATNERGEAAGAVVALGVVNQSVVTMADERTYKSMPTYVYLTSEVRTPEDLEHADVLLGDHPKAEAALDLLLGTQGWRRFVESLPDPRQKSTARKDEAVLLRQAPAAPEAVRRTSLEMETRRVRDALEPAVRTATDDVTRVSAELEAIRADERYAAEEVAKRQLVEAANAAVTAARAELDKVLESRRRILGYLVPGLATLASVAAVGLLFAGLVQRRGLWIATGSLAVAGCAVAVAIWTREPIADRGLANASLPTPATRAAPVPKGFAMPKAEAPLAEGVEMLALGAKGEAKPVPDAQRPKANFDDRDMPRNEPAAKAPPPPLPGPAGMPGPPAAPVPTPALDAAEPAAKARFDAPPAKPGDGREVQQRLAKEAEDAARFARNGIDKLEDGAKKVADEKARVELQRQLAGNDVRNQARAGRVFAKVDRGAMPGGGQMPAGFGGEFLARAKSIPAAPPFVVREYAHRQNTVAGDERADFAETLYWHPALVLPSGGLSVGFSAADSVTRYRVVAIGHTPDGRLGELTTHIAVGKPITVEPKLPTEVTASDTLGIPVTVANETDAQRTVEVEAQFRGLAVTNGAANRKVTVGPMQRGREVFHLRPTDVGGVAEVRFAGTSESATDVFFAKLPVVPDGFPVEGAVSDALERVARHEVVLPETWVPGSLKCSLNVFPSTLAELQKGLEGLLGEPGGCFEQTSTTNYPNALVLRYLRESDQANPDLVRSARGMLERGYAKLTAFEVPARARREGFEWFGQSPAHEALTAYGLMQFKDMATVTDVDPMLIERTRNFLLSRRDGKGGFSRNPQALDTFGRAPDDVTNAYIVWAVTEAGDGDDIEPELNAAAAKAKTATDPYQRALVANALLNRGRINDGVALLKELAGKLSQDGALRGAATSITGSGGQSLEIETTALAVLGFLKANRPAEFGTATRSAVAWIGKQRGGSGGFGATQSTILALKALIEYTRVNKQAAEAGTLSLYRCAELVGRVDFAAGAHGVLSIPVPDAGSALKPGANELRAEVTGKNTYPYTLAWSYRTLQPPSAEGCAVRLATSLDRTDIDEGGSARLRVQLENVSGKGQGMAVAIVGLPAGLKLPDDFKQLREMKQLRDGKPGLIGSFEVRGRELILYWRDLAPDAKIDLAIDVVARVPGQFRGPASRAYLYYTPELKHWTAPLEATVKAK